MKDIYDVVKELKEISSTADSDEVKSKVGNVIKALYTIQNEIYEELNSFDPYSEGREEINSIICGLREKIDYKAYDNDR